MTVSKTHKMIITIIIMMIINKIIIRTFIKKKTIHHFNLIFLIYLNYFCISSFCLFNNINLFSIKVISCMLIISLFRIITEILLYYFCSLQGSCFKSCSEIIKTELVNCLQNSSTISIYNSFYKINFSLEFSRFIKIKKITNLLQIIIRLYTIKNIMNSIILILSMNQRAIKNKKLKILFS